MSENPTSEQPAEMAAPKPEATTAPTGVQTPAAASVTPPVAAATTTPAQQPVGVATSGDWANGPMPDELKGWNWGAFFFGWIWAIANKTWIGLLGLIPYLNVVIAIVLGVKGNEWAWKNRKFASVDEFKKVQKAWAKWGVILLIASVVLSIVTAILVTVFIARSGGTVQYDYSTLDGSQGQSELTTSPEATDETTVSPSVESSAAVTQ